MLTKEKLRQLTDPFYNSKREKFFNTIFDYFKLDKDYLTSFSEGNDEQSFDDVEVEILNSKKNTIGFLEISFTLKIINRDFDTYDTPAGEYKCSVSVFKVSPRVYNSKEEFLPNITEEIKDRLDVYYNV